MKKEIYSGELNVVEAAEGMKVIMQNAISLIEESQILFNNGKYERSVTLAILAAEESFKVSILRSILLENDEKEIKKEWKRFRTHTAKNIMLALPKFIENRLPKFDDLLPLGNVGNNHGNHFEELKQLSLYTDFSVNRKWNFPKKNINKNIAKYFLSLCKILTKNERAFTSIPELEIWVKHLKPVWKKHPVKMKEAIISAYIEAEEKKVLQGNITSKEMKKFMNI